MKVFKTGFVLALVLMLFATAYAGICQESCPVFFKQPWTNSAPCCALLSVGSTIPQLLDSSF